MLILIYNITIFSKTEVKKLIGLIQMICIEDVITKGIKTTGNTLTLKEKLEVVKTTSFKTFGKIFITELLGRIFLLTLSLAYLN